MATRPSALISLSMSGAKDSRPGRILSNEVFGRVFIRAFAGGNSFAPVAVIAQFEWAWQKACLECAGWMMTLADFTSPELIIPHLQAAEVRGILGELSDVLQRAGRVPEKSLLFDAALKREVLVSTDMAVGMAFPHARLTGLKQLSFALGRADKPLPWSTKSAQPVRLIFLLAVPENEAMQYLQLISGISRFAGQPERVKEIHAAADAAAMVEVLRQIPVWVKGKASLAEKQ